MKRLLKYAAVGGGVLLAAKGLDNRLEVTHYTMTSEKIPDAFNGYRILQISDYHCDTVMGLVDIITGESPDIIVSTGDLVHDKGSYEPGVRLIERLIRIAPVYLVNGNHDVWRSDYSEFEEELNDTGAVTLHNERVIIARGDAEIGLAGIDDPFARTAEGIASAMKASIAAVPPYDGYNILLFHRANLMNYFYHSDYDLILSGHMHGGQMRLPWVGGVVAPKSSWAAGNNILFPNFVGGLYHHGNTEMVVNRGIGNPMIIPRLFNRPEIVVITLKSKKGEE